MELYYRMSQHFKEAETYDKTSSNQREDGMNLISLLSPKKGCKILDLGCGTGYLTKALAAKVGPEGKVVGIDPDRERLLVAEHKHSSSNVTYIESGGENIPGGNYDIVFSNSVLHWCADKDLVFKQVAKSLKSGGKFGFVVTVDFDITTTMYSPPELFSPECRQYLINIVHLPSASELLNLTLTNNFKLKFFKEHLREWRFADVHQLVEFHMTHLKGAFDETHFNIEAMKNHYGEGEIVIKMPYITIVAERDAQ